MTLKKARPSSRRFFLGGLAWCILSLLVQRAIAPKRIVLIFPAMHPTRAALSSGTPSSRIIILCTSIGPRKTKTRLAFGEPHSALIHSWPNSSSAFLRPGILSLIFSSVRNNINKIAERFRAPRKQQRISCLGAPKVQFPVSLPFSLC